MKKIPHRHPQGDRYDTVKDILSIVSNTQSIHRSQRHQTSIGYAANLIHPQTFRYLKALVDEGVLVLTDSNPIHITKSRLKGSVVCRYSLKQAIVITQYRNNKVEVFYAESFEKPQMNQIITMCCN
jgi:predicted transcriptional regulator